MKHFHRHHLGLVPLLSILAMSPLLIESSFAQRSDPALYNQSSSIEVAQEKKSLYQEAVAKIDKESLKPLNLDLDPVRSVEMLRDASRDLEEKIAKAREAFQKEQKDSAVVSEQRKEIDALILESLQVAQDIKNIEEMHLTKLDGDKESLKETIEVIESLLVDLVANEALVAAASAPIEEPVIQVPMEAEVAVAVAVAEKEVIEESEEKEDKKEKEEVIACEHEEENSVLTKQVEKLMADQNQIMQTMMGMAQMMVGMYQNQQQQAPNPYFANNLQIQNPYQYQQPFTAGNWVYNPAGTAPGQQQGAPNIYNIFNQPQTPQDQRMPSNFYPDQFNQQQSNWGLQPQMNFNQDPRYNVPQITPGTFGGEGFSFNMANSEAPIMY